ncbi:hypothetical protein EYF80_066922 [Liparis tanakae]|uniref:Uncharacterized protein n=1 Tax=Liparis tanakae TaxID=230148 RepID=A0A4Z2E3L4_9TELE|nr:hypothetical protein EYF80_066922 [Liparis tanakae]
MCRPLQTRPTTSGRLGEPGRPPPTGQAEYCGSAHRGFGPRGGRGGEREVTAGETRRYAEGEGPTPPKQLRIKR